MTELRKVKMKDGKIYFIDWRLYQLRNVDNASDYKNFKDAHNLAMYLIDHFEKEVV